MLNKNITVTISRFIQKMESHFNKGLELIYNNKIYDIDNKIRNKLIYTTLSIEYLYKLIYHENVLEDYERINMYI